MSASLGHRDEFRAPLRSQQRPVITKGANLAPRSSPAVQHEPRIERRPVQRYLGITRQVTHGVPAAVDQAFPALFAWLGERGIRPTGPPFIRTRAIDRRGEPLELDVAAPVDGDVQGEGEVRVDELAESDYLTFLHVGPYRSETETDLGDARASLMGFAEEHRIVTGRESERGTELPCCVEHLRVGPHDTPDYATWETELAYLIV
jgi:hypothetical protein